MCICQFARIQRSKHLLAQHVCRIGQSSEEVVQRELRILPQDLLWLHPVCQTANQSPDRDASPLDAGIPMVQIIGNHNMILPTDAAHRVTSRGESTTPGALTGTTDPVPIFRPRLPKEALGGGVSSRLISGWIGELEVAF